MKRVLCARMMMADVPECQRHLLIRHCTDGRTCQTYIGSCKPPANIQPIINHMQKEIEQWSKPTPRGSPGYLRNLYSVIIW